MTSILCCAVMIASQVGAASSIAKDSAAAVRSELVEASADDFMPTALRQAQVAGAIVAVVQGDRVVLAKGYGLADAERTAPVHAARTGFRIGSVAKVVTATAVMQLVEQGKLDLAAATLRDSRDHARRWGHLHGDRHGAVHDRPPPGRPV